MSSSKAGQPMSSNVIQPTTVDGSQSMETSIMTSMETTTTIINTSTLARDSGS